MEETLPGITEDPEMLVPCANCGRTFAQSSVERHFKICVKTVLHQQRGKFDSSKQRIQGTGLEPYFPPPPPAYKNPNRPRSRSVPGGGRRGSATQVHELCQFCGRSFGDKAIDRHREWCQSQLSLKPQYPKNQNSPAYERMQARTKYRAPLMKSMRARTREKYSPAGSTSPCPSPSVYTPASNSIHKRASLPNTSTSRPMDFATPLKQQPKPKKQEDKYDVYLSAERQLKELGLLNAANSPVLVRRESNIMRESSRSPAQSSPSPMSNHSQHHSKSSSSLSSSTSAELLIIEDEEEYLINKLAEDVLSQTKKDITTGTNFEKKNEVHVEENKTEESTFDYIIQTETASRKGSFKEDQDFKDIYSEVFEENIQNISENNSTDTSRKASIEEFKKTPFELHTEKTNGRSSQSNSRRESREKTPEIMKVESNDIKSPDDNGIFCTNSRKASLDKEEIEGNRELYSNNDLTSVEAENFFKTLKKKLERPDVTKEIQENDCPLTQSLQYLDAALSLFQLEDIPMRAPDAPRSKASTKRRLYSTASPLSLLSPDPALLAAPASPAVDDKCSECHTPFPLPSARFCCICGTKRVML